jgi:ribonuclease J
MKSIQQWLNKEKESTIQSSESKPIDPNHSTSPQKEVTHNTPQNTPQQHNPHQKKGFFTSRKHNPGPQHHNNQKQQNPHASSAGQKPAIATNNTPNQPNAHSGKSPLRVYPLGGFDQVGRNCFVIEVDNEIYIIDLGLQFPEEDMLGIDYLVPDISSLKGREHQIKAVLFTHGHLDHIGAVQHVLPGLKFPPCYGTKLTMAFVKKRLEEEKLHTQAKLQPVEYGQMIALGTVKVEFLRVTHSIPDAAAIAIHTKYGTLLHTGDFKFDLTPMNELPADFQRLAELGKQGVLVTIADSTNALKPGNSMSEREVSDTLFNLIRDAKGRVIVSTFSSLLNRIQQVIDHAKEFNRKVFIAGRSMETNIEIAQNLGYIKAPRGMIRKVGPGMDKIPDKEVIIITTGSQGEEMAGLARIGLGTHRHVGVKRGDTVILSSNPIIGNERAVAKVINNLELQGATVKTNQELALHTTGHGYANDIRLMHRLVNPKHIIPEHGEIQMRTGHANLAKGLGYQDNQIHLINNGEILEFDHQGNARKSKQKLSVNDVVIDGRGSAGEGQRVMNDRKIMSKAGVIVVVLKIYSDSKRLVGNPDIIARGLIYGSEQEKITGDVIGRVKKAYEEALSRGETDRKDMKKTIIGALYRYFDRELDREPMVVPVFIEV